MIRTTYLVHTNGLASHWLDFTTTICLSQKYKKYMYKHKTRRYQKPPTTMLAIGGKYQNSNQDNPHGIFFPKQQIAKFKNELVQLALACRWWSPVIKPINQTTNWPYNIFTMIKCNLLPIMDNKDARNGLNLALNSIQHTKIGFLVPLILSKPYDNYVVAFLAFWDIK